MTLRIPDISHWERGIDINKVLKRSDGLIVKATEGTNFIDTTCEPWVKAIQKTKKPYGFYHFFRGAGVAEAKFFYQQTKGYFGEGVPVLDVEVYCSKEEVEKFVKWIHAKTGVWCWIYTSASFINTYMNDFVKKHCGLWCAGYPSTPTKWTKRKFPYSTYTKDCKLVGWQFTDCLTLANKAIDASIFYITPEEWAKYAAGDNKKSEEPAKKQETSSKKDSSTDKKATDVGNKSVLYLAVATLQGQYGVGEERKKKLGSRYDEVQKFINHISRCTVNTLAKEVIQGKYGNGNTREILLGDKYDAVQKKVDEMLS